jgi:hypothetical protein
MKCEISIAVGGFAVISRRTSHRWTLVRGGSSNAESAVNPTGAMRPEEFRYHPNGIISPVATQITIMNELAPQNCRAPFMGVISTGLPAIINVVIGSFHSPVG